MRFPIAFILVGIAILAAPVRATIIAGPLVLPENGHTYYLLSQDTWVKSEAEAASLGGSLATVRNPVENSFLSTTFGSDRNLWIGLWDPTMESSGAGPQHTANFVWVSGDASSYRNWAVGEPNNHLGVEYYGIIWGHAADIAPYPIERAAGTWNDAANGDTPLTYDLPYGVVEVVPEPASIAIGVLMGLPFLLGRRRDITRSSSII